MYANCCFAMARTTADYVPGMITLTLPLKTSGSFVVRFPGADDNHKGAGQYFFK